MPTPKRQQVIEDTRKEVQGIFRGALLVGHDALAQEGVPVSIKAQEAVARMYGFAVHLGTVRDKCVHKLNRKTKRCSICEKDMS